MLKRTGRSSSFIIYVATKNTQRFAVFGRKNLSVNLTDKCVKKNVDKNNQKSALTFVFLLV